MLEAYIQTNNVVESHLLIDPDPVVRGSANKYRWKRTL